MEAGTAEKQIAILERGLEHHPGSEELLLALLNVVRIEFDVGPCLCLAAVRPLLVKTGRASKRRGLGPLPTRLQLERVFNPKPTSPTTSAHCLTSFSSTLTLSCTLVTPVACYTLQGTRST